ncbi:unnamed protein product [Schistosoma haematobium]|nr:unnamed protein product [Schistosoma haematobium]
MIYHLLILKWAFMSIVNSLPMDVTDTGIDIISNINDGELKYNGELFRVTQETKNIKIKEEFNEEDNENKDLQRNSEGYKMIPNLTEAEKERKRVASEQLKKNENKPENPDVTEKKKGSQTKEAQNRLMNKHGIKEDKEENNKTKERKEKNNNKKEREKKFELGKTKTKQPRKRKQKQNHQEGREKTTKTTKSTDEPQKNEKENNQTINKIKKAMIKKEQEKTIEVDGGNREFKQNINQLQMSKNKAKNEDKEKNKIKTINKNKIKKENGETEENVSQTSGQGQKNFDRHSEVIDSADVDERWSVDNNVTSVTKEDKSREGERGSVALDMDGETVTQVVGEDKMVSVSEYEFVDNELQGASRAPDVGWESQIEATPEPIDQTSLDVETNTVPMLSLTEDRLQSGSVSDAVQSVGPHEETGSHGNNSVGPDDNKEGEENVSQSGRTSHVDFGGHSTVSDSGDVDERWSVDNNVTSVTKEDKSREGERGSVALDMDGETVTQVVGEDKMVSVSEYEFVDNELQGASRAPDVGWESQIEATPEPIDQTSLDVETNTVPMLSLTEDRLQSGSVSDAVQSVGPHEETGSHGNNSVGPDDNKEGEENVSQSGRTSHVDFGGHSTVSDSGDVDERWSVDNNVTSVTKEDKSREGERGSVALDMDGETVTQVVGEDKMVSVSEYEFVDNELQGASRAPDVGWESQIEATPEPIDQTSLDVETNTVPMLSLTEDRLQSGSVSDAVQSVGPHEETGSHGNNSVGPDDNKEGEENVSQSGRTSHVDFGGHSTVSDSGDVDERWSVDNNVTSVTKEDKSREGERGSVALDMDGETVTQVVGEDKMVSVSEYEFVDNELQGASRAPDVGWESQIEATPEPIDQTSLDVETNTVPMLSLTEDRLQSGSVSDAVQSVGPHEETGSHGNNSVGPDDNKEGEENVSQSGRTSHVDFGGHSTVSDSGDVDERWSVDNNVTSVTKEDKSREGERGSVALDMDGETVTQVVGEDKMVSVSEYEFVDNELQGASRAPDVGWESQIEATPEPIDQTSLDVETNTVPMLSLTEDRLQSGSVSDAVQSVGPHEETGSHGNNSVGPDDNKEGEENVSQSGRTSHVDFGGHSTVSDSGDVDERWSVDNNVTSVTKEDKSREGERGSVALDMDGETVTQVVGEDKMVSVSEYEFVDNELQGASRAPDVGWESQIEATPEPIDQTSLDVETNTVPMLSLTEDRLQSGSVSDAVQSVGPHEETGSHGNNSVGPDDNKEGEENVSQSGRTSHVDFGGHSTVSDSGDVDERWSVDNNVTSVTKEDKSREGERGSVALDMDGETVTQVVGEDKMVSVSEYEFVDNELQGASRAPDVGWESQIEATPEPIDQTSLDVETNTVPMLSLTEDRLQSGSVSDAVQSVGPHEETGSHGNNSVGPDDNKEGEENVSQSGRTSHVDFGGHSTVSDSGDVDERWSVDNNVTSVTKEDKSREGERGSVALDMDGETVTQVVGEDKMVSVSEYEFVDNELQGASRAPDVGWESQIEATPEPIDQTSLDVETNTVPMLSLTEDRLQSGSVSDAVQSVGPHEETGSHGNNSVGPDDNKEGEENVSQSGRTSHVDFGGHSTVSDSGDVDERWSVDNNVTSVTKEDKSREGERGSVALDMDGETVTQVVGEDKMVSVSEYEFVDNELQGASRAPDVGWESQIEATPEPIDQTSLDVETNTVPMLSLTEDRLQSGSVSDAVQSVGPHEETGSHGNNSVGPDDNKEGEENVSQSGRTSHVDFGGHSTVSDSGDVDERWSVDNNVTSVTKEDKSREGERGSVALDMDGETVTQVVGEDKMVSVSEYEFVDNELQGASRAPDVGWESQIEATPEPIDQTSLDVETNTVPMLSLTEDRLQSGSVSDAVQSVGPHEETGSHGNNSVGPDDNKEGEENVSQSGRTSHVDFGGHSTVSDSGDVDERWSVDNNVTSVTKEDKSREGERGSVALDMDGETVTQVVGEDKMVSVSEYEFVDNELQGASRAPDVGWESQIEATPEPIDQTSLDVETNTVPMLSLTEDRLQSGSVSDAVQSVGPHEETGSHGNNSVGPDDNKEGEENVSQSGRTSHVDFGGHSTVSDSGDVDERWSVDNNVTSVTKEDKSREGERGSVALDMDGETVTQVVGEDKMVSVSEYEFVDNELQGASRAPDVGWESQIEATPEPIDQTSLDVETNTVPMLSLTEDRLQSGSVSDAVQSVGPHEETGSHGNNSVGPDDNKEGEENVSQSGRTSHVDFGGHSTVSDSGDVDERWSVDNNVTSVTKEDKSREGERGSVALDMDGETVTQVVGEDKMVSVSEYEFVDNELQGASRAPDVGWESQIEATPEPIDQTSLDVETNTVPMLSLTEDRLQSGSVSDAVQSVGPHEETGSHGNNSVGPDDNKEGEENVSQSGRTSHVDFGGHSTVSDSGDVDERWSVDNNVTSVTKEDKSREGERGSVALDMDGETVTQVVGEDKMVSVSEYEFVDNELQGASRAPDVGWESQIEATPEPIDQTSLDVETNTVPMLSLTEDRLQSGSVSDAVQSVGPHEETGSHGNNSVGPDDNKEGEENVSQSGRTSHVDFGGHSTVSDSGDVDERWSVDNNVTSVTKEDKSREGERGSVALDMDGETVTQVVGEDKMVSVSEYEFVDNELQGASRAPDVGWESQIEATPEPIDQTSLDVETNTVPMLSLTEDRLQSGSVSDAVQSVGPHEETGSHGNNSVGPDDNKEGEENVSQSGRTSHVDFGGHSTVSDSGDVDERWSVDNNVTSVTKEDKSREGERGSVALDMDGETVTQVVGEDKMVSVSEYEFVDNELQGASRAPDVGWESQIEATPEPIDQTSLDVETNTVPMLSLTEDRLQSGSVSDAVQSVGPHEETGSHGNNSVGPDDNKEGEENVSQSGRTSHVDFGGHSTVSDSGDVDERWSVDNNVTSVTKEDKSREGERGSVALDMDGETVTQVVGEDKMVSVSEYEFVDNELQGASRAPDVGWESQIEATPEPIDQTSLDVETNTVPMLSLTEDRLQSGSVSDAVQSVGPHEETGSHGNNSVGPDDNKEGEENVSQSGRTSHVDFGGHSTVSDSGDVDERWSVDNNVTSVTKEDKSREGERGSVALDMDGETVTQVVGEDKMVSVSEYEFVDNELQGASRAPDVGWESQIEATPEPIDQTSLDVETNTVPMLSLTEDRLQSGSVSDAVQSVGPHEETGSHGNNSVGPDDNKEGEENVSQSGRTSHVDFGGHSTVSDSGDVDERWSVDNNVTSVTKEDKSREGERGSVALDMDGETVTQVVGEDKMVSVSEYEFVDNELQGASRAPDVGWESQIEATPEPIDQTSLDVETNTVPMLSLTEDRLQSGSVSDAVQSVGPHEETGSHGNNSVGPDDNKEGEENVSQSGRTSHVDFGGHSTVSDSGDVDERWSVDNNVTSVTKEDKSREGERGSVALDMDGETVTQVVGEDKMVSVSEYEFVDNELQGASRAPDVGWESQIEATPEPIDQTSLDVETNTVPMLSLTEDRLQSGSVSDAVQSVGPHEETGSHGNNSVGPDDNKEGEENVSQSGRTSHVDFGGHSTVSDSGDVDERWSVDNNVTSVTKEDKSREGERGSVALDMDGETVTQVVGEDKMVSVSEYEFVDNELQGASRAPDVGWESQIEATPEPIDQTSLDVETNTVPMLSLTEDRLQSGSVSDAVQSVGPHEETGSHGNNSVGPDDNKEGEENMSHSSPFDIGFFL